jgi:hypothetical protein
VPKNLLKKIQQKSAAEQSEAHRLPANLFADDKLYKAFLAKIIQGKL